MYYTPAQMLAHLTVNGASPAHRRPVRLRHHLRAGRRSARILLELTWNGTQPLPLADGERTFLADGDEVVMRGSARSAGGACGWARCAAGSSR